MTTLFVFGLTFVSAMDYIYDLKIFNGCRDYVNMLPDKIILANIELNVCKKKHLTNTRSSSADEALTLVPPKILSLEQALDFIDVDELLEVTPKSLRIRKRILDPTLRKRANFKK